MNGGAKDFINNMGVLCETWTVIYTKFKSQGMETKEAIMHTQGFMTALIAANGGKNEVS